MRQWNRLRRLSLSDWALIVLTIACSLLLPIPMRILAFRRTQALLLRLSPIARLETYQEKEVQRVAALIARVCGWRILQVNCLERSLILWWFLRWHGAQSALRIGVRQTTAGFEAHAWVVWNGEVSCEPTH